MQRTANRWTSRRWRNTSSVGDMLDELEWPSLEARREQSSLTFFYKIHSGTVSLACSNCELWYHKDCMQMNTATYEALEKTDMSWCCFKCGNPNFDTSLFEDFEATLDTSKNSSTTGNGSFNLSDIVHPKSASSPNPRKRQPVTKRSLRILTINFQSIRSKKEAFWGMLEYAEPDIILASETWLQPGITERETLPPNNRFVARKDRLKDAHGGVSIIAKSDMDGVEIDV